MRRQPKRHNVRSLVRQASELFGYCTVVKHVLEQVVQRLKARHSLLRDEIHHAALTAGGALAAKDAQSA